MDKNLERLEFELEFNMIRFYDSQALFMRSSRFEIWIILSNFKSELMSSIVNSLLSDYLTLGQTASNKY